MMVDVADWVGSAMFLVGLLIVIIHVGREERADWQVAVTGLSIALLGFMFMAGARLEKLEDKVAEQATVEVGE